MDNKKIYTKKYKQGRVVVVDPNKVMDINENPSPRYIPQEDLVMYVKLTAHNNSKTIIQQNGDGLLTSAASEEVYINFLNPIDESKGTNSTNSLTTKWTDLFEENNKFHGETFGIKSIKIEYNASYVPTINITFVDIRGKTLFERGDDPNNPYNLFFQFPYPQFTLTVKGYFGRTVNIPLILEKTNTSFDGQSGDYTTEATFRSFTFALLNDIPLRYIVQAPYMYEIIVDKNGTTTYEGMVTLVKILEQYAKPVSDGGLGVDLCEFNTDKNSIKSALSEITNINEYLTKSKEKNYKSIGNAAVHFHKKYPITIPDFLYRLSLLESDIAKSKAVARRLSSYYEILKTQESFANFEKEFRGAMLNAIDTDTIKQIGNSYLYDIKYFVDNNDPTTINNANQILSFISNSINLNVCENMSKMLIGGVNYYESLKHDLTVENLRNNLIITKHSETQCLINPTKFINEINNKYLNKLDELVLKSGNVLNEKINLAAKARLGFEPTLKNVLILFLANFETFLTLLFQKSLAAQKQIDDEKNDVTNNAADRKRGPNAQYGGFIEKYDESKGSKQPIMYPWPDFFKKDNQTEHNGDIDRAFPGDLYFFRDREEMKFINELIESVIRMQEDIGNRGSRDNINDKRAQINYTPITPEDVPVMFFNDGNLTLDYNAGINDITIYNPEDAKQNSGQYKFSKNGYDNNYTTSLKTAANILVKAMENAIFLGFSSADPNNKNNASDKFDDIATQFGQAHGNNLFNIYKAKSPELFGIHNIFTKSTTDLSISFFDELFINQRGDGEADKKNEVIGIKDLINTKYRTMWRNVSMFTPHNPYKEQTTSTSSFSDNDKILFGRNGVPVPLHPGYNNNINAFKPIELNENYKPKSDNNGTLGQGSIDDLITVCDKTLGNYDCFLDKTLINQISTTNGSAYSNTTNDTNFNLDNSINIRKLYIGSQDTDNSSDRDSYLSDRYYWQKINSDDNHNDLKYYHNYFYRDTTDIVISDEDEDFNTHGADDSSDDFITFDDTDTDVSFGDDTDVSDVIQQISADSGTLHMKLLSFMDTLSFIEGTSNVTEKTQPAFFKNNGYDICLDSLSATNSGGKIIQIKDGGSKKNLIANWAPEKNIKHPRVRSKALNSDACGRYQFLSSSWDSVSKIVFGVTDVAMTKSNQDIIALWTLFNKTTKATANSSAFNFPDKARLFRENRIQELFQSVSSEWASIPGYHKQSRYTISEIMTKYNKILAYNKAKNKSFDVKTINYINTTLNKDNKLT